MNPAPPNINFDVPRFKITATATSRPPAKKETHMSHPNLTAWLVASPGQRSIRIEASIVAPIGGIDPPPWPIVASRVLEDGSIDLSAERNSIEEAQDALEANT